MNSRHDLIQSLKKELIEFENKIQSIRDTISYLSDSNEATLTKDSSLYHFKMSQRLANIITDIYFSINEDELQSRWDVQNVPMSTIFSSITYPMFISKRNCGVKCVNEIKTILQSIGLNFKQQ